MRLIKLTIILSILVLQSCSSVSPRAVPAEKHKGTVATTHSIREPIKWTNRYNRFMSGRNYIKIRIKNSSDNEATNFIVDNYDFASFLAKESGLSTDRKNRFLDYDAFWKFIRNDYVDYMLENEGKLLDVNLNDFKRWISETHSGKRGINEIYLNYNIMKYEHPLTFKELGVKSKEELIKKFFDDKGWLKAEYDDYNPSFIAALMELGLFVGRGDLVPILFIVELESIGLD